MDKPKFYISSEDIIALLALRKRTLPYSIRMFLREEPLLKESLRRLGKLRYVTLDFKEDKLYFTPEQEQLVSKFIQVLKDYKAYLEARNELDLVDFSSELDG